MVRRQAAVNLPHPFAQARFVLVVVRGVHMAKRLAHHNHLGLLIAGGFEQHRVHSHVRFDTRRFGLEDLRPAHFSAIAGNPGIQRHILRFERAVRYPSWAKIRHKPAASTLLPTSEAVPLQHDG